MQNIKPVKISELADIADRSRGALSQYFKDSPDELVIKSGGRIVGVMPEAATEFLSSCGYSDFLKSSITLSANLCGGVGKTTSIYNLGICMRRLVDRNIPILYIDCDSQGSFTKIVFGKRATDDELILIDYLDNRASIKDILTKLPDNCWFVKSNLRQAFFNKSFNRPAEIKEKMLKFYKDIFNFFGCPVKIFQDHTPQLSEIFASSVSALHQLENIEKNVIVPIRTTEDLAIEGGNFIFQELDDIKRTFQFKDEVPVTCFFSSIDHRISTTVEAINIAKDNPLIVKNLANSGIRFSIEVPKANIKNSNIFNGKNNKAAEDYQRLCKSIFFKDNKGSKSK